jgi:hypothetical protein
MNQLLNLNFNPIEILDLENYAKIIEESTHLAKVLSKEIAKYVYSKENLIVLLIKHKKKLEKQQKLIDLNVKFLIKELRQKRIDVREKEFPGITSGINWISEISNMNYYTNKYFWKKIGIEFYYIKYTGFIEFNKYCSPEYCFTKNLIYSYDEGIDICYDLSDKLLDNFRKNFPLENEQYEIELKELIQELKYYDNDKPILDLEEHNNEIRDLRYEISRLMILANGYRELIDCNMSGEEADYL